MDQLPVEAYDLIFEYARYCDPWTNPAEDDFILIKDNNRTTARRKAKLNDHGLRNWMCVVRYPIINLRRTCKIFNELFVYQYNKWLTRK